jgi:SAM-dependent methyltransferase
MAFFWPGQVCHNSFPHFADKPAALNALARLMRPGGYLLILHDLGWEKVNAIHSGGGAAIQNDLLPPGEETGQMLVRAGFGDVQVEDSDERYMVAGQRVPAMNMYGELPRHRFDKSFAS